jgi:uncharacterized protein
MMIRKNKIVFAIVAALVLLTTILAGTLAFAKSAPSLPADTSSRTVSVSGNAQVTIKPDIAYVSLGTVTQDATVTAARDANNALMAKVIAALKAQGIDTDKDVTTTNYSINPRYDANGAKTTGYEINNNIQVKVRDLDKLGAILEAATAAGANNAGGLSFDKENSEDAYNQAIVQAIANAKQRAEALAKSANATLGTVVTISENGSYSPSPIYYGRGMAADSAASVPVSTGSLQISATVSVTYELK